MLLRLGNVIIGCAIFVIGILILHSAQLITGGTSGLALSIAYIIDVPFSIVFIIVNIPFYILSVARMGWSFTISTIGTVTLLSLMSELHQWLPVVNIPPVAAAIFGGLAMGLGVTILFLNRTSLGGASILALYVQTRFKMNPAIITFGFDALVVSTGFYTVGWLNGLYSVLSIFVLALVITFFKNKIAFHNPTRSHQDVQSNIA